MTEQYAGHLQKMATNLSDRVEYQLPLDDVWLPLNNLLGSKISLQFVGEIHCTHCGRRSNKSFNQGYCYPCFKNWRSVINALSARKNVIIIWEPVVSRSGVISSV